MNNLKKLYNKEDPKEPVKKPTWYDRNFEKVWIGIVAFPWVLFIAYLIMR